MEDDASLARTLDVHGADLALALERAAQAIEQMPAGGALSILTGDRALEAPVRALCAEKGHDIVDGSEPGTLCFIVYRQF